MSKEVETMKKFLLAVAVLCVGTMAFAGPNAGGTLIAHDANLLMSATDGLVSICGQGLPLDVCENADIEIDGTSAADVSIFKVYAAFAIGSAPRLMGIAWGVTYDPDNLFLTAWGKCGDFELNDDPWPSSGSGSSVTWNTVQQGYLTPVYWFGAYTYGNPTLFNLGPNPSQGGVFGDDTVPAILDAITCFGAMGFDTAGHVCCPQIGPPIGACCDPATGACALTSEADCQPPRIWHPEWTTCEPTNPCPQPQPYGACCDPATGLCTFTLEADCLAPNVWHGDWVCDPNPCPPPTPVETKSWGQIKANYR
jgi:hypothetical protein